MIESRPSFGKRHIVLLVLIGMAIFLWGQGSRREAPDGSAETHVVTGTVATYRNYQDSSMENGRYRVRNRYAVTIAEQPSNVSFRIERPPPGGLAEGAQVRMEVRGDPAGSIDAAQRFPDSTQVIDAAGLTVNGETVYSAAASDERGTAAVWA